MGFARIGFLNFRNLADGEIDVGARRVLLVGENGQGKTNLLEAVYLLSVASSFREDHDAAMLRDPALPAATSGPASPPAISPSRGSQGGAAR
jgi:DNA replication and repair protein RecF